MVLVYAKKHTGLSSLDWDEAVEEALCFGWIDSRRWRLDERFFLQIFTPRTPKSRWSGLNKKRVAALIETGLMMPAGQAAIDLAKKTGRWSAYDAVDAMVMPPDLKRAIARTPGAAAKFKALTPGRQKQFLYFLHDAKKDETRLKRIAHIVKSLASSLIVIVMCGLAVACGGGSPSSPSAPGYAGQWSGTTTQGRSISFTVSADQKLTSLSVGYSAGACTGTKTFTNLNREFVALPNYPGPVFGHETHAADGTDQTRVEGWFTSSSTATGTALFLDFPGCGSGNANWSATKQ